MANKANATRKRLTGDVPLAHKTQPDHLAEATIYDYFDLSFAALPHKILAPEKFESAVLDLRKRFTDRQREDFVFKPGYHKRIPADGVAHYMESIWVRAIPSLLSPHLVALVLRRKLT
jgi:hypothetical protein